MTDPPPAPPRRSRLAWPLVAVALLALAGALLAAGFTARADGPAPVGAGETYGTAPTYRLVDQNGDRVSSRRFAGKVQVVSFLFPYCTSYCPLLARDMARLADAVSTGPLHGKVQIVSFNVDPREAGPGVLRRFIAEYGGHPADPTWEYLTGTPAQIRHVVSDGFRVYFRRTSLRAEHAEVARQRAAGTYTRQPVQRNVLADRAHLRYDVVHNDDVEIVDPSGRIVALFDQASRLGPARLLAAVRDAAAGRPVPAQPVG